VKHGVMRTYVKGLEVVLPTGTILNLGGKLLKNVAGYDLMQLIIGSQGTLGVITKVILRLYPKVGETATLVIPYRDRHDALRTVPRILQGGMLPLAIEYVDSELMYKSARQLGKEWPVKRGRTCLLIIVTGNTHDEVYLQAERIHRIAAHHNAIDTLVIENRRKQQDILNIRNKIYFTLKPDTLDILDVAVPPASIARLMDTLEEIAKKYHTHMPAFGHAGDGNLHAHIMREQAGGVKQTDLESIKREIYDATIDLGGTITAEHGIGKIRTKDLCRYLDQTALEIMKKIKEIFDPNNILNPEAVIP
jgi:glycolate oxidase